MAIFSRDVEFRAKPDTFNSQHPIGGYKKRLFDIIISLVALMASALLLVIIFLTILLFSFGNPIFKHERIGYSGRKFKCLKFRTMHKNADEILSKHLSQNQSAAAEFAKYRKLKNDPRIIPVVGSFLRKTSLDELPQLFNVLIGDMSLIGPRPVTGAELKMYDNDRRRYEMTRPGITGLWQISGRNELTFDERVQIDCSYVRDWSFKLDLVILVKTPFVVLTGKGAM